MNPMHERNIQRLFETGAIKVCPPGKPFWYTSGTIGPYYINTHYLYGSEEKAIRLLNFINNSKDDVDRFHKEISVKLWENYCSDCIYRDVIDQILVLIKDKIGVDNFYYISGGERRDWFFSFLPAKFLEKPHLTIYKDFRIYEFDNDKATMLDTLAGKSILHIADLLTEGSSYERAWIPAVKSIEGFIRQSVVVVDRKQGGRKLMEIYGIELHSMIEIGKETFKMALDMGLINEGQYNMITGFMDDPRESMKKFLINNPRFIEDSLNSGGKDAERARLCIENNIYGINNI